MEAYVGENGLKLRRGRISLERKKEILEQYDLLSKPCSDVDAAAIFGVSKATLTKILSERDEIKEAVTIKNEAASTVGVGDSDGESISTPKLKRGRLSYEKQQELLAQYDQLPKCSYSEAAGKLGIKQKTLTKLLGSRREISLRIRKRKKVAEDSSSDSDNYLPPNRVQISTRLRRGPISSERQKELLQQYDKIRRPRTHQAAAAELGISQGALTALLSKREASSTARLSPQPGGSGLRTASRRSPQPGTSGLNMALRKGRRVRAAYSENEQSGSDYKENDSDFTDDEDVELEDGDWDVKQTKKKKHHSLEEKQQLLAKFDELPPCPQWRAAQILGLTQPTLSNWLHQRALATTNSKSRQSKRNKTKLRVGEEESDFSGEEIDSYVMGSTKGTQVVQFFEVSAEEQDKKSNDSAHNDSNSIQRKPHMTLREKFELYKTYDSMNPKSQRNAAATFNLNRSTWFNLITNRYYYEERFKKRLCQDMSVLNKYDELENKRGASKILGVQNHKLIQLLASRETIERYFAELFGSNEDGESIAPRVDETEFTWKDSKALRALETQLLQWFKQANSEQIVNWKILKEKAKDLAVQSGMDDFEPSNAWLRKWNKTNRVFWNQKGKLVTIYGFGENRSVSECVLTALKDYPPENVFNLVETGLYYQAVPGYSPITKDWLTVTFACNMSGSEKKTLLAVGKSEAPLSFRVMTLPLVYKYSSLACMTEELFCAFLQDWDRELAETHRKIAIVLDSSTSHANVQLDHIRLFFVPMDCSKSQPLNAGIVGRAKALFRKRMAESLQQRTKSTTIQSTAGEITIVDALFAIAEAWENVPKPLMVSKFLKSTFPQNDTQIPDKDDLDDQELERLNKLDDEIQLHSTYDGLPCLKFSDEEISELEGGHVVHMEGTLKLSEEEEDDFDIKSLLHNPDTPDYNQNAQNSSSDLGSKLKNFLAKTSTPNGSHVANQKGGGPPTVSDVRGALAIIKKFLQLNGGTLEDLTDYTQLEIKVLSKIKNLPTALKLK